MVEQVYDRTEERHPFKNPVVASDLSELMSTLFRRAFDGAKVAARPSDLSGRSDYRVLLVMAAELDPLPYKVAWFPWQ